MSHEYQSGDSAPGPGELPGDSSRLHHGEPSLVGGDRAPVDIPRLLDSGGTSLSAPFIRRPVATSLLSIAIILAGGAAYSLLPVSSLPQVEFPTISVSTGLPGADPETMASAVATPLERQFSKIAGITQMTSSSSLGSANVTMQFDLNRDVNGAARDVQAAMNAARSQLPANLPSNPTYRKINPSESPILILALTSDTLPVPQLYDAADSILSQKIAQVSGVGQVTIGGSAKPAVRIEANPTQLASYGIGLDAVRSVIGQVNVHEPTGYFNNDTQRWSIKTTDQLFGANAYKPLIVATDRGAVTTAAASNGLPASEASAVASLSTTARTAANAAAAAKSAHGTVRVSDIADVVDSVEDIHTGGLFNGKPAILLTIMKSPGANVISTVDAILKILPLLQSSINPAIKINIALDRTTTIRASVKDVTRTLMLSIVLVVIVVFIFLREVRSTLIPSVSVPLSLLGTFGIMYLLGYTLDNLSLMALTISTGFVVDDAIVVIENISRHLEEGLSPWDAAMLGSREIGFTVLSMSISLIAVFIPILLMGGIVGRLFREFAVTLSAAILVSLMVSLTTTPMLSAKFLKAHSSIKHGPIYRFGERCFDLLSSEYDRALQWVLRHRALIMGVFLLTFAVNGYLFYIIPKGFFPQQDTGRIQGQIRAQQDTSFLVLKQHMADISAIVQKDPGVENVATFLGGGGGGTSAMLFLALKPDEERIKHGDTADVIINRLRPKTANMPGVQFLAQSAQDLTIGGRQSAAQYQYSLTTDKVADLDTWSPLLMAKMQTLSELKDVNTDLMSHGLEAQLVIDRDTATRLGVSPLAIDETLSDAFGQAQVSVTYMPLNQYHVVLEAAQKFQQSPDALENIYVKSTTGAEIPLSAVTHYEEKRIPLAINHQGLSPASTISFNLTPGVSLSEATLAIEQARIAIGMPTTIHGGFQGTAQAFQTSLSSEPVLILLALVTVYIVLGMLYESFIHPLTILSTLPSAGVGALVALLLFKVDLNVIAMIGIILLIGIVKKNAIMMIDFALVEERDHGRTPEQAIYRACLMRFRPIMMTTMAALLGGLPLALGTGTGSELRRPLGIAIVGGLIVSQCLTLFTTPVVYLFFDGLRARFAKMRRVPQLMPPVSQPVAGD